MRLIDADALIDRLDTDEYGMRLPKAVAGLTKVLIDDAPSIDIVRCKDCKYWVSDGGALMKCDIHKDPTVPDHYCSYGEEDKDE